MARWKVPFPGSAAVGCGGWTGWAKSCICSSSARRCRTSPALQLLVGFATKSCKDAQKPAARGTVAAHCTTQYQKQWLLDRAAKHGFALTEDSFTVTRVQWHRFAKRGTRPVSLLAVTYEGVLQVTDPEAFRNLLCQGMGRGKAYGLGLLTVMRGG